MEVINEDNTSIIRVRPRFHIHVSDSIDDISEKINLAVLQEGSSVKGKINHGFGTLHLPVEDQHYWSPQLAITMEVDDEQGGMTSIRGLYGPRPAVWSMFVFFYAVIALAVLVISIIGFSNRSLGESSTILWFVPFLVLLFLSLYLVAYFGQKLGHDQMIILHEFLESATGISFQEDL